MEYHKQNNAQMINTLLGSDTEVNKIMIEKPNLHGIFALPSQNRDAKYNATELLKLIVNDKNDDVCTKWRDIPELYENIYRLEDFNNKNKQELRNAIFIMDKTIDDIFSAYEAYHFNLITEKDYETYLAFFSEIGTHPLFLCSIYMSHKNGYLTKKFAHEIKIKLLRNSKRKEIVASLYPDLLKEDWAERVGIAK